MYQQFSFIRRNLKRVWNHINVVWWPFQGQVFTCPLFFFYITNCHWAPNSWPYVGDLFRLVSLQLLFGGTAKGGPRGGGGTHSASIIRGFSSHTDGQDIDKDDLLYKTGRGTVCKYTRKTVYTNTVNLLKIYGKLLLTGYRTGSSAISYLACEQFAEFGLKGDSHEIFHFIFFAWIPFSLKDDYPFWGHF
jgi:hypothetical protein